MKKIYILHGWAYSNDKWHRLVKDLKNKGFDVTLLNIPGLTAPISEVWKLEDYVNWLKNILDKEKEVILIGHSNGGRISLSYTRRYPEKVTHLVLIDSAGIYHNDFPIRLKRYVFGKAAKFGKMFTKSKNIRAVLYRFSREHDYEKADPIVRQTMLNLIRVDLQEDLPNVSVPTTIIWGEQDRVTPLSDGQLFKDKIPNATLHVIPEARHSPMFTHAEKVAELIEQSL